MNENILDPKLAKMTLARDDAISGVGKFIVNDNDLNSLIAGVVTPICTGCDERRMIIGTIILVPAKVYEWRNGTCGWRIGDLLTGGLGPEYWKEVES